MKITTLFGMTTLALAAAPLAAQTSNAPAATAAPTAAPATTVAAGATIYDKDGGVVGTVDSVNAGVAVVSTGTNKVGLPLTSFGTGTKGPMIAMSKAELDAAAGQAAAQSAAALKAQLTPGTTVYGKAGSAIGTIKDADDQYVTIAMAKGPVKLPVAAFGRGDSGPMISMTADELDKAVSAAAPTAGK